MYCILFTMLSADVPIDGAYGNESVNTICSVLVNSTIVGLELGIKYKHNNV